MGDLCLCTPKWKPDIQKDKLYGELVCEWDMKSTKELTLGIGDFKGHVKKRWMNLKE